LAPLSNRIKQAVSYSPFFPAFPSNAFALFSLREFKTSNLPLSHIAPEDLYLARFLGCHQLIREKTLPNVRFVVIVNARASKPGAFSYTLQKQSLSYSKRYHRYLTDTGLFLGLPSRATYLQPCEQHAPTSARCSKISTSKSVRFCAQVSCN